MTLAEQCRWIVPKRYIGPGREAGQSELSFALGVA